MSKKPSNPAGVYLVINASGSVVDVSDTLTSALTAAFAGNDIYRCLLMGTVTVKPAVKVIERGKVKAPAPKKKAAPKPVSPDWSDAPSWANFATAEKRSVAQGTGVIYWWAARPTWQGIDAGWQSPDDSGQRERGADFYISSGGLRSGARAIWKRPR